MERRGVRTQEWQVKDGCRCGGAATGKRRMGARVGDLNPSVRKDGGSESAEELQ